MRDLNKKFNSLRGSLWDSLADSLGNDIVVSFWNTHSIWNSLKNNLVHSLRNNLEQSAQSVEETNDA
jgi:uncharacterized protein YukE